jgi:CubicO group peptidase (beta-lactamase class C family)
MVLKKPTHPITVKNVLTHTSGLPFMSRGEVRIDTLPLATAALSYALSPLNFQPDSQYAYSNAGINTAGRIIEVVSHRPYEKFMDQRLFAPLGMKDTTFWPSAEQLKRLAKSYRPNAAGNGLEETLIGQLTYPLTGSDRSPCPAGGLFSTASDVGLFCRMILNGGVLEGKRYLSEAAVRQMTSTQTSHNGYGLGWSTSRMAHGTTGPACAGPCGHGGAYATEMWIDPDRQLITVFMVQHAGFPKENGSKIMAAFKKGL